MQLTYSFKIIRTDAGAGARLHDPNTDQLVVLSPTGVSGHGHKHWGSDYTHRAVVVRLLALCMMVAAIGMAIYSAIYFRIRGEMLL